MKTKPNQIFLSLSLLMSYSQMRYEQGDTFDWSKILDFEERPPVSLIQICADDNNNKVVASVVLGWKEKEIKIGKIEVAESWRGRNIGNTMMSMLFSIAKFYHASKITGVIDGELFLWDWYKKLGFTIYDNNKLLLEIGKS